MPLRPRIFARDRLRENSSGRWNARSRADAATCLQRNGRKRCKCRRTSGWSSQRSTGKSSFKPLPLPLQTARSSSMAAPIPCAHHRHGFPAGACAHETVRAPFGRPGRSLISDTLRILPLLILSPHSVFCSTVSCPICEKRKAERFCPAKGEKICAVCCGKEREIIIDCPVDCTYLIAAHRYEDEHPRALPADTPLLDVEIPRDTVHVHQQLMAAFAFTIAKFCVSHHDATDIDVLAAARSLRRNLQDADDRHLLREAARRHDCAANSTRR